MSSPYAEEMNKHHQHRALLLQEVGQFPNDNLRKRPRAPQEISETDCAPVPPPLNMRAQPAGDCLIPYSPFGSNK